MNLSPRKLLYFLVIAGVLFTVYFFVSTQDMQENSMINNETIAWTSYKDTEFGFLISYPSTLQKTISTKEEKVKFGKLIKDISFHTQGLGNIGVKIYSDLTFNDFEDFLKLKNSEKEHVRYEKEKEFLIGVIPAMVFHAVTVGPEGQEEHFLNTKYAIVVKDKRMFEIWTRFEDEKKHEQVWQSFKFIEK